MTGHTKWENLRHKSTDEQLDAARRDLAHELTLAELRKARDLTQAQLAEVLDTTQPGISAIERRADLYLSTLRSYVKALGGELELNAVFPDGVVTLTAIGDLVELPIEYGIESYPLEGGLVRVITRNLREFHDRDRKAGDLAHELEQLQEGHREVVHVEPGTACARVLFDVVSQMNPPFGQRNPPFRQLVDALQRDSAVMRVESA